MKTLFIAPDAPGISVGGIERHVKNLIAYCCQNNKEAVFLLPAERKESQEKNGSVVIIKKKFLDIKQKRFLGKREVSAKELKEKSREFFEFVKNLIKTEGIKIINAQNFHLDVPPAYNLMLSMACFLNNVPMVVRVHSFITSEIQKALIDDLAWAKVLCVSKSVAGDCFAKGINIDKLHTQYLGVDRDEFKPFLGRTWLRKKIGAPDNAKIILHASRILEGRKDILKAKGITTLMDSFSQLSGKDPFLRLVIAVAVPPKRLKSEYYYALEKLRGYAKLHNIEDKVIIKEFDLEEMPLVYNGANIFVMASENETFGQVYIEAMACGAPVVGTNVGGVPEIITDGFNGFLVPPNNPSVLSQKIEEILNNEELRKNFVTNGLQTVKRKFSSEKQCSAMFNYLAKLAID